MIEKLGLSLALLGLAIGIVPLALDDHTPKAIHLPLGVIACVFLAMGFVVGLEPLRRPLLIGLGLKVASYPFLFVYLFPTFLQNRMIGGSKNNSASPSKGITRLESLGATQRLARW